MKALIYFMWFFFDFSFMCARFHWYLTTGFQLNFSNDENSCKFFGWLPINANIHISSDGAEKFSIGLGLIIWALIAITVIVVSLAISLQDDIESADDIYKDSVNTVWTLIAVNCVSTLFCCQQSCVLMPLTSISMNPATLNVPTDQIKAVCYHKWAMIAIPYGIPMVLGAGAGVCLAMTTAKSGLPGAIFALFCVGAAIMLFLTALALFVFWLFGGFAIGMWFTFGSLDVLVDLALIKILVGPSIVLLDATSAFVSMTFGSAACCAALIICPSCLQNLSSRRLKDNLLEIFLGISTFVSKLVRRIFRWCRNGRPSSPPVEIFTQAPELETVRQSLS
jgi:hypothetical protein